MYMVGKLVHGDHIEIAIDGSKLKTKTNQELVNEHWNQLMTCSEYRFKALLGSAGSVACLFLGVTGDPVFLIASVGFGYYGFSNQFWCGYHQHSEESMATKNWVRIDK